MRRTLLALSGMVALSLGFTGPALTQSQTKQTLPDKFDLRTVGAVTPIKAQQGGTCWTHGTMAAIESNLLISGAWKRLGHQGDPAVSEYHLDWWNGFNKHKNDDVDPESKQVAGLTVHQGGDYRVSAAYISRGDGVVLVPLGKGDVPDTKVWYKQTPPRHDPTFMRYYVRDIEWFTIGDNLENIETVKRRIMSEGALGTAYTVGKVFLPNEKDVHYQPISNAKKPNHAVAIVGWDDTKVNAPKPAPKPATDKDKDKDKTDPAKTGDKDKATPAQPAPVAGGPGVAPKPGAWLIKNSWGPKRGNEGYFWISYYDKICCRDPEMGAVSFRNIEPMRYDQVYFHDYHGWRDTMKDISKAFNAYAASDDQELRAVSFYTSKDNVGYTAKIYRKFVDGKLLEEVATQTGQIRFTGFHTIDLDRGVPVKKGEKFYVYLDLTAGGQAIDRTSEIPVLLEQKQAAGLKGPNGPLVLSKANPGESFYLDRDGSWKDLYEHRFENPNWATFDRTANFCMKALAVNGQSAR